MRAFGNSYRGSSVLLTGHTGFKGSWLATWLNELGANVCGYSLPPTTEPNHWDQLGLPVRDERGDIRNLERLQAVVQQFRPDIVFHLAAQPLVRRSYRDPLESWSTNVMGTANVLEACRHQPSVRAIVVVTTDKVYANEEWVWGYREADRLGGHDPYSASKAATELLCDSYRKSFFQGPEATLLATARAGNVIGGGDWSEDRLVPDVVKAIKSGRSLEIRSPNATRPWQHVLDCLSGYLLLGQHMLGRDETAAGAWNFGPDAAGNRTVAAMLNAIRGQWPELEWHLANNAQPHEAGLLYLDSSKARSVLGWRPVWTLDETVVATVDWYRRQMGGQLLTQEQIRAYVTAANIAGCNWVAA